MKIHLILTAALPMIGATGAALAGSYSGNWPVTTVTKLQPGSSRYCLTLVDDGSLIYPHSGHGSLGGLGVGGPRYATFQLIGHTMVVTVEVPGGTGMNSGLVLIPRASNGSIGMGVFDDVGAGEEFNSGTVAFGPKGGC